MDIVNQWDELIYGPVSVHTAVPEEYAPIFSNPPETNTIKVSLGIAGGQEYLEYDLGQKESLIHHIPDVIAVYIIWLDQLIYASKESEKVKKWKEIDLYLN